MSHILFLFTLFLLGFRHGFDFDHIAAISDITGANKNLRKGFTQSVMYVLGHAFVVLFIGILAIFIGATLPNTYEHAIEILVGLSLIILGLYLFFSLITKREAFVLIGRGGMLISFIEKLIPKKLKASNGLYTAFLVGIIHGIGAETPSQVLLLTLSGTTGKLIGSIGLLVFILGLVIANTIVSLSALFGYARFLEKPTIRIAIGVLMAVFSFYVGLSVFLE